MAKYWSFSFSISPSNDCLGLASFTIDWLDLLAIQGTHKSLLQQHSSKASILQCSALFIVQLSYPYMTTGKTIALTRWTFSGKVMSLLFNMPFRLVMSFSGDSDGKASAYNAGDPGSIPGSGKSPGEGNGNPFQYSCLENPMDRGAWWATVHGVAKSQTRLSDFTHTHTHTHTQVGHSFSSKEQVSFNSVTAVTICTDFGAPPENKVSHCFHCLPIYLP